MENLKIQIRKSFGKNEVREIQTPTLATIDLLTEEVKNLNISDLKDGRQVWEFANDNSEKLSKILAILTLNERCFQWNIVRREFSTAKKRIERMKKKIMQANTPDELMKAVATTLSQDWVIGICTTAKSLKSGLESMYEELFESKKKK
jgi:hypothetical protein|nr:MAG TPA_asm: hypothetical protein [Caudoviricetes sp.]